MESKVLFYRVLKEKCKGRAVEIWKNEKMWSTWKGVLISGYISWVIDENDF